MWSVGVGVGSYVCACVRVYYVGRWEGEWVSGWVGLCVRAHVCDYVCDCV